MRLRTKFQDEDFELGEVVDVDIATMPDGRIKLQGVAKAGGLHTIFYDKLEKLYDEWEDYEEPKEIYNYYYLDCDGEIYCDCDTLEETKGYREIGNYFETEEDAVKAREKIKAVERLKGLEIFTYIDHLSFIGQEGSINFEFHKDLTPEEMKKADEDLDLLFGGEE